MTLLIKAAAAVALRGAAFRSAGGFEATGSGIAPPGFDAVYREFPD